MSKFSNLIDISSFFIGVLINLLLIAMICFYFKRKIDNLELSQSEQAKMLYKLISDNSSQTGLVNHNTVNAELDQNKLNFINNLDLTQLEDTEEEEEEEETNNNVSNADSDTDSGSGSDSDSDSESENEEEDDESSEKSQVDEQELISESLNDMVDEVENMEEMLQNEEPRVITMTEENNEESNMEYEKMTVKELKNLLATQGVEVSKKNAKKQELIDMVKNNTAPIIVSKETPEIENSLNYEEIEEIENINDIN